VHLQCTATRHNTTLKYGLPGAEAPALSARPLCVDHSEREASSVNETFAESAAALTTHRRHASSCTDPLGHGRFSCEPPTVGELEVGLVLTLPF